MRAHQLLPYLFVMTFILRAYATEKGGTVKMVVADFPVGIPCSNAFSIPTSIASLDWNGTFLCTIKKNDDLVFSRTISASNMDKEGLFFDAQKDWANATVNISMTSSNETQTRLILIKVEESFNFEGYWTSVTIGREKSLGCSSFRYIDELGGISENQAKGIESSWFKNDDEITRDDPDLSYHNEAHFFDQLTIRNASCETPARYKCVLKYKGNVKQIKFFQVCVKTAPKGHFSLRAESEVYKAEAGTNLTVSCGGDAARQAAWMVIDWFKTGGVNAGVRICGSRTGTERIGCGGKCSCKTNVSFEQTKFCEPCALVRKENKHPFIATLVLKNISYEDDGFYKCGQYEDQSSFQIIVQNQTTQKTANQLIVIVTSSFASAFFLIFVFVLYRMKRAEAA